MSEDQHAIADLMERERRAFVEANADLLRDCYTETADWTNAFGRNLQGRDAIADYLRELFADSHFTAGQLSGEPSVTVRPVREDVVVIRVYSEVAGQRRIDDSRMPVRRNNSLKVLVKCEDGRWRIDAEMFMDARDDVTHITAS